MTLRAKESRAETITGGLCVLTVRHVRPDMTASDVLAAINMVRRVLIPDLDIYRTANILVKQHGEDAPIEAAMRADAMLEKGDLDGYAVWRRILRAVDEL